MAENKEKRLTAKEKAFCEYFVFECLSATAAYEKAYECSRECAGVGGYRALRREHVKEYINKLQKEAYAAAQITAEKVALKLSDIAFAQKDDEHYTASQQLKALDLLQKQLGVQKQKIEADVNTDINITIEE